VYRKLIYLVLIFVLFSLPARAEEKKGLPLDITSDEVEYSKEKGQEVVIFIGHVVALQGTTALKSERLELYPDTNKAVATGAAWMRDKERKMVLTGDKIEYYHDREYGLATGEPKMIDKKEDCTLTGKRLEVFMAEDRFRATGAAKLVKDEMVATARVFDYFNKEKKAVLTGNPEIREKDSVVKGETITLYVDEYRVVIEEKANIKFIPEE
jgi:lipopolysaccharide transport protein LptA